MNCVPVQCEEAICVESYVGPQGSQVRQKRNVCMPKISL
jgi:hypothetical protein